MEEFVSGNIPVLSNDAKVSFSEKKRSLAGFELVSDYLSALSDISCVLKYYSNDKLSESVNYFFRRTSPHTLVLINKTMPWY